MIVELAAELFERDERPTELISLFDMALNDRHRLRLADDAKPAFDAWAKLQSRKLAEWCRMALHQSAKLEALAPADLEIRITCDRDDPHATPVEFSLASALPYLQRPLTVLLEHGDNDARFLKAFATANQRNRLDELLNRGVIKWEHRGGLQEVRKRISRCPSVTHEARRLFAVFDSDALLPGEPSPDSAAVKRACEKKGIGFFQTQRRFQESYLPKSALHAWGLMKRKERLQKTQAVMTLSDPQRHHFNFKRGFDGDAGRIDELRRRDPEAADRVDRFYEAVTDKRRRLLATGLASDIGSLFAEAGVVDETKLRKDGSWDEVHPVVAEILRLAR